MAYLLDENDRTVFRQLMGIHGIRGRGVRRGPHGLAINQPTGNRHVTPHRGQPILFGFATAAWTSGNTVTLTPCVSISDGTPTGADDITCYINTPTDASPEGVEIDEDDILAYVQISSTHGLLVNVKQGDGNDGGGGTTLPAPSALYEVLQITSFTSSTVYTMDWDYVRGS